MSDTTVEVRVPDLLTVMEAGAVARISRTTAYDLAHQFLATNGEAGMPVKRVGGQLRVPRDRFEEWIGTAITAWPPVTDTDTDDVTAIAVNDTPTVRHLHQASPVRPPRRHDPPTLQRLTRDPAMFQPTALNSQPIQYRQVPANSREYSLGCWGWPCCG